MKLRSILCLLLTLACLVGYGRTTSINDSIPIPGNIMEIPSLVSHDGDRVGVWGLPTLVALRYGLEVNDQIDERLDEQASQEAVERYLSDLYQIFGDWDQCLMAYLYSPAYVKSLQARHQGEIIKGFNKQRYAEQRKIESAKRAEMTKKAEIARKKAAATAPKEPKYITYTVKRGDNLSKIAKKHHVSVKDLKKWNHLKNDFIRENDKLKIYQ